MASLIRIRWINGSILIRVTKQKTDTAFLAKEGGEEEENDACKSQAWARGFPFAPGNPVRLSLALPAAATFQ